ncbi:DMT family transporter [Paenibacillus wulumuqiensis]|uniref:DMT family transporter n=1 Tax=Paenibacillus wulumuqiensis TaxID=1567107 RepID=UPI00061930A3|nr:DMT family transporter [Paenibacillus wulumuqiensis]
MNTLHKSALVQLILSMAIFGSVGFFSGLSGLPAVELVWVRCVCAVILIGGVWWFSGTYRSEVWQRREVVFVLLCGTTLLLNWVFLFKSFELTSVTVAISLYHLAPVIAMILGSVIFREKLTWMGLGAILLCFAGTLLIVGAGQGGGGFQLTGAIYAIIAAFFYAATMLLGKSIRTLSVYATTFIQMLLSMILLLPFISWTSYLNLSEMNWTYSIITGFVHTGIVYLLFYNSVRYLPTRIISALVFVDPAVAILLDVLLTGFRPDGWQWGGVLLIFAGMFYIVKPQGNS